MNIPIFSDTNHELSKDELFSKTVDWVLSCQTYEGGFGAGPGHEAHGGYTFCGTAILVLLNQLNRCDIGALLRWTANKQLRFEGGFCGRWMMIWINNLWLIIYFATVVSELTNLSMDVTLFGMELLFQSSNHGLFKMVTISIDW